MSPVKGTKQKNKLKEEKLNSLSEKFRKGFIKRWKYLESTSETQLCNVKEDNLEDSNDGLKRKLSCYLPKRPSSLSISSRWKPLYPRVVAPKASPDISFIEDFSPSESGLSTDLNSQSKLPLFTIPIIQVQDNSDDHSNTSQVAPPFDLLNTNDESNHLNKLGIPEPNFLNFSQNNSCDDSIEDFHEKAFTDINNNQNIEKFEKIKREACNKNASISSEKRVSKKHTINLNHTNWRQVNYIFNKPFTSKNFKNPDCPQQTSLQHPCDTLHCDKTCLHRDFPIDCQRVFQDTITRNAKVPQLLKPKLTFRDLFSRKSKKFNQRSLSFRNKPSNASVRSARADKTVNYSVEMTKKQKSNKHLECTENTSNQFNIVAFTGNSNSFHKRTSIPKIKNKIYHENNDTITINNNSSDQTHNKRSNENENSSKNNKENNTENLSNSIYNAKATFKKSSLSKENCYNKSDRLKKKVEKKLLFDEIVSKTVCPEGGKVAMQNSSSIGTKHERELTPTSENTSVNSKLFVTSTSKARLNGSIKQKCVGARMDRRVSSEKKVQWKN